MAEKVLNEGVIEECDVSELASIILEYSKSRGNQVQTPSYYKHISLESLSDKLYNESQLRCSGKSDVDESRKDGKYADGKRGQENEIHAC
jgi:hypothetical protein